MGAIICKVAVEAPGNNFESVCLCLCVRAAEHVVSTRTFTRHYRTLPSQVSGGEKVCRVEEEMPGDYCAV